MKSALLVVDVQNDFVSGALAVPDATNLVRFLNDRLERLNRDVLLVATMDWHPPNHESFISQGGEWPEHCVQGTWGAELADGLKMPAHAAIVKKGLDPAQSGYSAFEGTGLAELLAFDGVGDVLVTGIATDYCVAATARGAQAAGFRTTVILGATRAVSESSQEAALKDLIERGISVNSTSSIWRRLTG